jgi:hypothetical protein
LTFDRYMIGQISTSNKYDSLYIISYTRKKYDNIVNAFSPKRSFSGSIKIVSLQLHWQSGMHR